MRKYIGFCVYRRSYLLRSPVKERFYNPQRSSEQSVGSVPSPPRGTRPHVLSRMGFSIPTARRFPSDVAKTQALALSAHPFFRCKKKNPASMHALGETRTHEIDLTVVGTRTTHQATGDAGWGKCNGQQKLRGPLYTVFAFQRVLQ